MTNREKTYKTTIIIDLDLTGESANRIFEINVRLKANRYFEKLPLIINLGQQFCFSFWPRHLKSL